MRATPLELVRFECPAKWTTAPFRSVPLARAVKRKVVRRPTTAVRGLADSLILGRAGFGPGFGPGGAPDFDVSPNAMIDPDPVCCGAGDGGGPVPTATYTARPVTLTPPKLGAPREIL